jgi:predicted branched-subunit amino acid permease
MLCVVLGHVFAGALALPAGHPVFFASVATLIAILVPIWRGKGDLLPWVVAAAVALMAHGAGLGQPWPVLAGALAGGAAGAWMDQRRRAP